MLQSMGSHDWVTEPPPPPPMARSVLFSLRCTVSIPGIPTALQAEEREVEQVKDNLVEGDLK